MLNSTSWALDLNMPDLVLESRATPVIVLVKPYLINVTKTLDVSIEISQAAKYPNHIKKAYGFIYNVEFLFLLIEPCRLIFDLFDPIG